MNRKTFALLFFVRRTKLLSNGEVPVYLRITVDGSRSEFSINRSIKEVNWDPKRSKAKGKSKESQELNSYIDSIRMQIYRCQKQLEEDNKEVTATSLKQAYHEGNFYIANIQIDYIAIVNATEPDQQYNGKLFLRQYFEEEGEIYDEKICISIKKNK